MKSNIAIQNESSLVLDDKLEQTLERAVLETLRFEGVNVPCEVSILLCKNDEIHALNLQYRDKDKETDVLSFSIYDSKEEFLEEASSNDLATFFALGDVVIAPDVVLLASEEIGDPFPVHLSRMCIHSVLHLLGYDHELGEAQEKEMISKQETILTNLWEEQTNA